MGALALAIFLGACGESHVVDVDASADGGRDAGALDAGDRCGACNAGRSCLRGVCVDDCGGDVASLDSELAPDLVPVANVCAELGEGSVAAVGSEGAIVVYHAHLEPRDDGATVLLDRYEALLAARVATRVSRCRADIAGTPYFPRVVAGVGLSPGGRYPHFGVHFDGDRAVAYLLGDAPTCTLHARELAVYGGSVMLDEDPRAIVFNGRTRESLSGVFRGTEPLAEGFNSGSIVRHGGDALVALRSGRGVVELAAFEASDLRLGPYPVEPRASTWEHFPLEFVALEGRGIVGQSQLIADSDYDLYPIEPGADAIPFASERFASARFTAIAGILGTTRVLLVHERGLLIVE